MLLAAVGFLGAFVLFLWGRGGWVGGWVGGGRFQVPAVLGFCEVLMALLLAGVLCHGICS